MKSLINSFKSAFQFRKELKIIRQSNNKPSQQEIFFIVSPGRSGSTLLRKILMESYNVHIPPESEDIIPKMASIIANSNSDKNNISKNLVQFLDSKDCFKYWNLSKEQLKEEIVKSSEKSIGERIYSVFDLHKTKSIGLSNAETLIGDKTPFLVYYLEYLKEIFPNSKIIYLNRTPHAVVNSYIKSRSYSMLQSVHRWNSATHSFLRHRKVYGKNCLIIDYNNLVSNPETLTSKLGIFLNIKPTNQSSQDQFNVMGDTVLEHHSNVNNPVNTDSIAKWKNDLSPKEIEEITKLTKKNLNRIEKLL